MAYEIMEITVINGNHFAGWLAGAVRIGEVYMSSVDTMVTNVLNKVGSNGLIERLNIVDHGTKHNMDIGKDVLTAKNLAEYETTLAKLAPKFSGEGFVHLQHCEIGNDLILLKGLAKIFKVPVYAGLGDHNSTLRFNNDLYVVCFPGGMCCPNMPRP